MPIRLRRRALAFVAGLLVAIDLTACAETVVRSTPADPRQAASAQRADLRAAGARIVDDEPAASLVLVPKRANGGLVVFLHGWGQTRWSLLGRREEAGVADALTEAGYTVLAADAKGKAWGDPTSVEDYRTLIRSTLTRYDLHDVYLMGESMGGLATVQLARSTPEVRAATLWFPVCDLRTMTAPRFRGSIRDAWRGRSRSDVSPVEAGDTPMLVWASDDDTVVDAARNAAVCVDEAKAAGAQVTWFHTTGEHGDPSNYQPSAVVRFFERHRTPGV